MELAKSRVVETKLVFFVGFRPSKSHIEVGHQGLHDFVK